jgi:DUF4097 and DUF4098 domain-containing protein YvlB
MKDFSKLDGSLLKQFFNQRRTIMKKRTIAFTFTLIIMLLVGTVPAQEDATDRVAVQLTDPGEPVFLSVGLVNGGIIVTGYAGDEVIVESRSKMRKMSRSKTRSSKAEGMKRIPVNSSSLTVEEHDNKIEIDTDSWANPVDLIIKVPHRTSLELSCVNSGDIRVENITGDIEVSNTNGAINLMNINGSAVANALNKDITVTFDGVDPDKDMSFTTLNGDIDVTFPASLKAKVKLKANQGDVYSDFEISTTENPERVTRENRRSRSGKYEIKIDRSYWGLINGGGQVIQFSNFNGDIFIRKGN